MLEFLTLTPDIIGRSSSRCDRFAAGGRSRMGLGATSSLLWNRRPTKWCFSDPVDPQVSDDTGVTTVVSDVGRLRLHCHAEGQHVVTLGH